MKSFAYTLVVLFGALSFANADAAKDQAGTEEVVVVEGAEGTAAEGTAAEGSVAEKDKAATDAEGTSAK